MDSYDNNRINNVNRYIFNDITNQTCQSNNELLYKPTESNWNLKRKRIISGISYLSKK